MQMRDVKTRQSIGVQMYCYLVHVRPALNRESDVKEWEEVKKEVLHMIHNASHGESFGNMIVQHVDRETIWEEWKERKLPPMIPFAESIPPHKKVDVSLAARQPGDVRNLCREDTLNDFVLTSRATYE